jgi:hypothetical protein
MTAKIEPVAAPIPDLEDTINKSVEEKLAKVQDEHINRQISEMRAWLKVLDKKIDNIGDEIHGLGLRITSLEAHWDTMKWLLPILIIIFFALLGVAADAVLR